MLIPLGFWAASGAGSTGSYELISTTLVSGSSTAYVTFDVTGLGSTYKHLQIRMVAKAAASGDMVFGLNNDTGTNYSRHFLYGNGSSVSSGSAISQNYGYISYMTATTNVFAGSVIDFLDAFSTTKNKTVRALTADGTSNILLASSAWYSTNAITSIKIQGNGNFASGSRLSIYGVK